MRALAGGREFLQLTQEGSFDERQVGGTGIEEALEVGRVGRRERSPCVASQLASGSGDRDAPLVERAHVDDAVPARLAQVDQARPPRAEPIEDLDQLKLVVEVALEPEDDFLRALNGREGAVAGREHRIGGLVRAPAARLDEPGPDVAHLLVRARWAGYRPFVQHVLPGNDRPRQPGIPNELGDDVAVRDVQHRERFCQAGETTRTPASGDRCAYPEPASMPASCP